MSEWTPVFLWFPKRVKGKMMWLTTVYRSGGAIQITNGGLSFGWDYGTIFDVLSSGAHTVNPPPKRP